MNMNIDIIFLHTSGHADISSYKKLNELVNPKKTVIIHTEDKTLGKEIFNNVVDLLDNEIINVD